MCFEPPVRSHGRARGSGRACGYFCWSAKDNGFSLGTSDEGFFGEMTQPDRMNCPTADRSLALLPEVEARALFAGRQLRFCVLRPPYAALGLGTLRVLRVSEREAVLEIVAGYDGYERLDAGGRSGRKA